MAAKVTKRVLLALTVAVCLWLLVGVIDFMRVYNFERPIFCAWTTRFLDGGSGTYTGLGYSFEIKGNFISNDEMPGVTEFTAKIFNVSVLSGIRD